MQKENLTTLLKENSYPGRGILLGRSADNRFAVTAYFIMGRSENSRNRVFTKTEDGIRTEAHDPSKMTDPSLIIYHPVRELGQGLIVTNGDQTDTIRDYLCEGRSFQEALRSREFEPDGPNFTPRISGLLSPDGSFQLSILKSADGDPSCCHRYFYLYDHPLAGEGRFIHTLLPPVPNLEKNRLSQGEGVSDPGPFFHSPLWKKTHRNFSGGSIFHSISLPWERRTWGRTCCLLPRRRWGRSAGSPPDRPAHPPLGDAPPVWA